MILVDAKYIEDDDLVIDAMTRRWDYFLICLKCYYFWERKAFNYQRGTFADPDTCPCCNNDWTTPFSGGGKAPSLDKGDPQAWSPYTNEFFPSRPEWLKFQAQKRKSRQNPMLPVSIAEYQKHRDRLIKERDAFIKKLEDQQIDKIAVFKMIKPA